MDLTSALVAEAIKMGLGGLILLGAVLWLARRDKQFQADDRKRTDERISGLEKTITANKDECQKREADMTGRIRQLEDQRHEETSTLLVRSVNALETTARVVEHLVKEDTGLHRALNGDKPR